ncbi:MAG: VOC family protein [Novosphingobium sp.]|nr:VOC family protein [Novosphingobium sp.]
MFSHIMIGAQRIQQSRAFYDAILGTLEHAPGIADEKGRIFYMSLTPPLIVGEPIDGKPATGANGGTIGFSAGDSATVDAWFAQGLAHGGTECEDPPGFRTGNKGRSYYAAYLRDPAGNKVCAVYHPK